MAGELSRRALLGTTISLTAGAGCLLAEPTPLAAKEPAPSEPFGYCFNTSTIMGQGLPLEAEIDLVAKAGYSGIEPWISELDKHVKAGGSLKDIGKKISDLGLKVPSAIGFFEWIVDDEPRRKKALEEAKRNMDMVAQIGGVRLAAPPVGATDVRNGDLPAIATRYRELLEIGLDIGVVPEVELWGFSKTLSRLGEVMMVAIDSGHAEACVLLDIYHLYKGGNDPAGLKLIAGNAVHVIHLNDYPADPPRKDINDAARIFPGDGVAPFGEIFRTLRDIGFRGMLSLELFNREYWKEDPLKVARAGLEKSRALVQKSLA